MMAAETKNTKAFYNTEIPIDWEEKRFDEFAPLQRGFDLPVDDIIEGEYPVVFSNGILKYHNEFKAKAPGVVTGRSGTIGKVTYVQKDYWPHNTSLWVTNFKGNEPLFVFYYLVFIGLDRFGSGSGVPTLNRNDVHSFKVIVPPSPEQKAIAQVLSTADAAIHSTEKLIAQKELRKKWLMQQLLTGKKRLKGFEGKWKEKQLKKLCKISKGEQLNKIELVKTGTYPSYSGGITPSGYTDDWNTHENTIIISEGGNSCGYVNFITTKFWCGGHCYALLDLNQTIKRDFLYQFLKFNEYQIMKLRVGSGLPNVQKGDVENFCVKHPSFEEQTAIAQVLQAADKEISLLKAKAEKLREQKRGLMQVLLTGKVRLKIN